MNKMTKGAIATGIGVALLLGGGGTLAVWSDSVKSGAGTITAGNLDLESKLDGMWESDVTGPVGDINEYLVVPGETLTYTENLTAVVDGNGIEAELSMAGDPVNGFGDSVLTKTTFTKDGVKSDSETLSIKGKADVTAVTEFTFKAETSGRQSVMKKYSFGQVTYKLQQTAPTA
ncbi:alternate-type signal peptide domain-containing protein [Arthrobacter crystallopoietes]|uniref:alternate-type signal peptide domain-containing protein n=1 Tax=Crystallibacter crystallopoietes TaxID=37928 RepID=UPI003D2087B1